MSPTYPSPLPEIVEVLDAAIRADLETVRYEYFVWLLICTGAVFVGLVCEVGEIWHDVIRKGHEPSHNVKRWAAIGWLLIVLGVGGEGVFEGFVSWTDSTLQTFNNILLEATQREAGSAAQSATTAHEESTAAKTESDAAKLSAGEALTRAHAAERSLAKAESDAGKAQTEAASALTTAIDAAARAGKAEASLGKVESEAKNAENSALNALAVAREARQEAASFESDLARLKQQAEDRILDEYQQDQVKQRVQPFVLTPYELAVADTPEAEHLLTEIDAAVGSAGWLYRA